MWRRTVRPSRLQTTPGVTVDAHGGHVVGIELTSCYGSRDPAGPSDAVGRRAGEFRWQHAQLLCGGTGVAPILSRLRRPAACERSLGPVGAKAPSSSDDFTSLAVVASSSAPHCNAGRLFFWGTSASSIPGIQWLVALLPQQVGSGARVKSTCCGFPVDNPESPTKASS